MDLTSFRVDEAKVKEGVVKKFDEDGKCYIRVARHNNEKFQQNLRKGLEQYKSFRRSKIPEDVVERVTKEAMAKTILLEMVGFTDGHGDITGTKGAMIEDTYENRLKVLVSKNYDSFLELVSATSMDFEEFKVESEVEEVGN